MQIHLISYTFQRERGKYIWIQEDQAGFEFQYKSLNFPPSCPDYPWCNYERVQRGLLKSDPLTLHVQASEDWAFGIAILYFFVFHYFLHLYLFYRSFIFYYRLDPFIRFLIPFIRFQFCITDYKNKWSGEGHENIVKLITSPMIKLQSSLG